MAGDNNLSLDMAYSVDQIKALTENKANFNLYVYFDGFSSNVPTVYCDFSGPKGEFFKSAGLDDKLIKRKRSRSYGSNENSASMYNMINFVDWSIKRDVLRCGTKSKRYAFIISGHSFGFMDWGLFKDEKADYSMSLSKLRWLFHRLTAKEKTLKEWFKRDYPETKSTADRQRGENEEWVKERKKERTTELIGKKLDLIGFDSCVMSTLEIGSQFQGLAKLWLPLKEVCRMPGGIMLRY